MLYLLELLKKPNCTAGFLERLHGISFVQGLDHLTIQVATNGVNLSGFLPIFYIFFFYYLCEIHSEHSAQHMLPMDLRMFNGNIFLHTLKPANSDIWQITHDAEYFNFLKKIAL